MNAYDMSFLRSIFTLAAKRGMQPREFAATISIRAVILVDIYRTMTDVDHGQEVLREHITRRGSRFARFSVAF